jgi:hypothetical protein
MPWEKATMPDRTTLAGNGVDMVADSPESSILSEWRYSGASPPNSCPRSGHACAVGLSPPKDDRRAGLTMPTSTPGGNLIAPPGGGITTAGTSTTNQMTADRAKKKAMSLQEKVEKARSAIEEHYEKHHNFTRDDLDIRLTGFLPPCVFIPVACKHAQKREPTSGLEPLSCSLRVCR